MDADGLSPVMLRAKAHYERERSIEIPEWGDDDGPLVVFWKPRTLAQAEILTDRAREQKSLRAIMADTVITMATDADGKALFTKNDKQTLMRGADGDVVSRIYSAIIGGTVDDHKKK